MRGQRPVKNVFDEWQEPTLEPEPEPAKTPLEQLIVKMEVEDQFTTTAEAIKANLEKLRPERAEDE